MKQQDADKSHNDSADSSSDNLSHELSLDDIHSNNTTRPGAAESLCGTLKVDLQNKNAKIVSKNGEVEKPRSTPSKLQLDSLNSRHTCVSNRLKRTFPSMADRRSIGATSPSRINTSTSESISDAANRLTFINSLTARRRFFRSISIEPMVFLAVLALYIEFPAMQDMIYTKICMQVVYSKQINSNGVSVPSFNSTNELFPANATMISSIRPSTTTTLAPELNGTYQLVFSSKIIDSEHPPIVVTLKPLKANQTSASFASNGNLKKICDRYAGTSIDASLLQMITDQHSIFWLRYQMIICLLCMVTVPHWGGLSDRIGRIVPLTVPIIAALVSNLLSIAVASLMQLNLQHLISVDWLYVGAVLNGLSGGQMVFIVNSFSFISDNSSGDSRSTKITILEAIVFISHSIGFYISKLVMSMGLNYEIAPRLSRHISAFVLCKTLNVASIVYSILFLRNYKSHRLLNNFEREQQERMACSATHLTSTTTLTNSVAGSSIASLNDLNPGLAVIERRREVTASSPDDIGRDGRYVDGVSPTKMRIFFTFDYYKQTFETLVQHRASRSAVLLLIGCGFISSLFLTVQISLQFTYLKMEPFNWNTSEYSLWNSISSITRGASLIFLSCCMRFVKSWNFPDTLVSAAGFMSKGIGLLMIALAQTSDIIYWSLLALLISDFSIPPLRSLLSKLVLREEVGKIFSCLAAAQSICFALSNLGLYLVYQSGDLATHSSTTKSFYRLAFMIVAISQFAATAALLIIHKNVSKRILTV